MATDISKLSNNEFVFFKFQLDPQKYFPLRYHRSRFGSNAYIFPLHDTKLLRFGHIYTLDPAFLSDDANNVDLALFHQASKPNEQKIREVKSGDTFHYPLTKKDRELKVQENIFYGPLILKGIALYLLNEAYHMHSDLFVNLISNRNALESKEIIYLLDTMLTRAMKINESKLYNIKLLIPIIQCDIKNALINNYKSLVAELSSINDPVSLTLLPMYKGALENEEALDLGVLKQMIESIQGTISSAKMFEQPGPSKVNTNDQGELSDNVSKYELIAKYKTLLDELSSINHPFALALIPIYKGALENEDKVDLEELKEIVKSLQEDIKTSHLFSA